MKLLILAGTLLLSLTTLASTSTVDAPTLPLHCKATHNYKVTIDRDIAITPDSSANPIGEFEGLVVLLNHRSEIAELEVYNPSEESRSYAKASFKNAGDKVELARWTRDYIFEITCERIAGNLLNK